MRHASLFSGIGGFDLAARWLGWENVMQCEIEPFCQKILRYYFPSAHLYGDIRDIDGTQWKGKIDILTGGFPCQPFSAAGRRRGTEDNRFLWPEMLRVIREIQPTWIVAENVRGITSIDNGMVFERVCAELEANEYEVQPFCIPACAVGAPHKRERIWFVAHRSSERRQQEPRSASGNERADGRGEKGNNIITGKTKDSSTSPNRKDKQCERRECCGSSSGESETKVGDRDCDASHSNNKRLERCKEARNASKIREDSKQQPGGLFVCNASDTNGFRPCCTKNGKGSEAGTRSYSEGQDEYGQSTRPTVAWAKAGWQSEAWLQAATRLCSVDDGLPRELDGITVPKWRIESLKAYGNAIVPQVAYQIFRAIDYVK